MFKGPKKQHQNTLKKSLPSEASVCDISDILFFSESVGMFVYT